MLQNGNLTVIRVLASAIIGLVSVGGGIYLLAWNIEVPNQFWLMAAIAIGGVVGVDVAAAVIGAARGAKGDE